MTVDQLFHNQLCDAIYEARSPPTNRKDANRRFVYARAYDCMAYVIANTNQLTFEVHIIVLCSQTRRVVLYN